LPISEQSSAPFHPGDKYQWIFQALAGRQRSCQPPAGLIAGGTQIAFGEQRPGEAGTSLVRVSGDQR